ncbi:MAG: c-type cytochrome [Rhodobacteraceae bacterium]|nr:c-type cytochrome [Paracoccaceae bacterium]
MSKSLNVGVAVAVAGVLTVAYNFADRNVVDIPDNLPRMAELETPPQPAPMGAAMAADAAMPAKFGLGRAATPEEVAAWDIDVRPDGQGLPVGSGSVMEGEEVFVEKCSVCHGVFGEGSGRWPVLTGGTGTLASEDPVKTIESYWPYLSTVYDYIYRAMPFGEAQSLTHDEVYAITAYLLNMSFVVDDDFVLSNENFSEVSLANEENFFPDDRMETEFSVFVREACMTDCKDAVEITARAAVVDVTPDDAAARAAREVAASKGDDGAVQVAAAEETPAAAEAPAADNAELIKAGERVFKKCSACHQVGEGAANRSGPQLNGLMGRTAGGVDGFRYSNAMVDAGNGGLVWSADTLAEFLADPRAYVKGTKMAFRGIDDAGDLAALAAYLGTFNE